jgi:hypothetical protein
MAAALMPRKKPRRHTAIREPINDPPDGSPLPYSDAELKQIADHLGPSASPADVEVIVGIARDFQANKAVPPHLLADAIRDYERLAAEAAAKGANLLRQLEKLYLDRHAGLRRAMRKMAIPVSFGGLTELAERLDAFAAVKPAPRSRGRKPQDHVTVALMNLIFLWERLRGKQRGRIRFFRSALAPLKYEPDDKELGRKITEADAYLKPQRRNPKRLTPR